MSPDAIYPVACETRPRDGAAARFDATFCRGEGEIRNQVVAAACPLSGDSAITRVSIGPGRAVLGRPPEEVVFEARDFERLGPQGGCIETWPDRACEEQPMEVDEICFDPSDVTCGGPAMFTVLSDETASHGAECRVKQDGRDLRVTAVGRSCGTSVADTARLRARCAFRATDAGDYRVWLPGRDKSAKLRVFATRQEPGEECFSVR